jgi:hypothetical protein
MVLSRGIFLLEIIRKTHTKISLLDKMMTQDRSINISGSGRVEGIISTGDNARNTYNTGSGQEEYLPILKTIIDQLVLEYADASSMEKKIVLKMKLQSRMRTDPTFRDRFASAVKAGGAELIKVLTNNPFVSVPLEIVKGWLEADPQH